MSPGLFLDSLRQSTGKRLNCLREYGLKLSPNKCKFFQTSFCYFGHIISNSGVKTDPENVQALNPWARPQYLKELQSFLGFSGYFRRFVKDYSRIVKSLSSLTAGYPPQWKEVKVSSSDGKYLRPPKKPLETAGVLNFNKSLRRQYTN